MTKQEVVDWARGIAREAPRHHEPIEMYLMLGVPPGGFLEAVITNNFVHAFRYADEKNLFQMRKWAEWAYMNLPIGCRGLENFDEWLSIGGMVGSIKKAAAEKGEEAFSA